MPDDNAAGHQSDRRGILTIGNLIVDKTHTMAAFPPESLLAVITHSAASPGGGAINVLLDLARVDPSLPLSVAGLVGSDEDGAYLRRQFEAQAIDASRVGIVDGLPTSFTHVMISEASATRTLFQSHGASGRLDVEFVRGLTGNARIAHLAYLLLLAGLDVPDAEFGSGGAHALSILRDKGFRTSLDLVSRSEPEDYERFVVPALRYTDYLIVNEVEAAQLTGRARVVRDGRVDWQGAFEQGRRLLGLGVGELVAIHFPQGAVAVTRSGVCRQQSSFDVPTVDVVSALGAGDAFCAGMLYGLHEGYDLGMCLKLGSALGHFNLFAESATDGAHPLSDLLALIRQGRAG